MKMFEKLFNKKINKILIIRLGAIGDVVHTSNVYRSIKAKYPDVEIHYLTSPIIKPIIEFSSDLDKVITINPKELKLFSKSFVDMARTLKKENYDLIINLQPSFKTMLLCRLASFCKVLVYKKSFKLHAVTNFWMTAKKHLKDIPEFFDLKLVLNPELIGRVEKKVLDYKRPFIVLNAGGIFSKRQGRTYPIEKWVELGNELQKKYNGTVFITGVREDAHMLEKLEVINNSVSFVDKLTLEENTALISISDLMISGDSGPLHIASALGVKSVGLYGSMPVKRTGVYGSEHVSIASNMPCVPCNRRKCKYLKKNKGLYAPCMSAITVKEIVENLD